ncbi:hypothetical protein LXL04_037757 [Taraxacum kok-saghyz]
MELSNPNPFDGIGEFVDGAPVKDGIVESVDGAPVKDIAPSWEEVPGLILTWGQRSGVRSLQNPIWVPLKLVSHVGKFSLETLMGAGFARFAELELEVLVEILRYTTQSRGWRDREAVRRKETKEFIVEVFDGDTKTNEGHVADVPCLTIAIKKKLEDLITRHYLERDKQDPDLIRYLA